MTLNYIISMLIALIMALLAMAFYTLLERKMLGYFQTRKGPNKVSLAGIPQPLADAMKLLLKQQNLPTNANIIPFLFAPVMSLILALFLWSMYPHQFSTMHITFSILIFIAVSSLNVYTTLGAGWTSNSKYALLGALRSVAQTISYEISMSLILICPLIMSMTFSFYKINTHTSLPLLLPLSLLAIMWFITALAETNRTPFDLAEGESELVSGFNTEYSAGEFTLIFMAEYMNILIISLFSAILFMSAWPMNMMTPLLITMKTLFLSMLFIWVRATLPRMRYDRLMNLTWKTFLPMAIFSLFLVMNLLFIML
nr:NADH dehydrogenase subunit 1 [Pherusa bengalensis]